MRFMAAAYSSCGLTHTRNDDRAVVHTTILEGAEEPMSSASLPTMQLEPPFCVAVFDGVGGSVRGDLAAMKAAETLVEHQGEPLNEMLEGCAKAVIEWQSESAVGDRALTVGAGMYVGEEAEQSQLFHVGDCRIYRFRDEQVELLTYDHSLAQRYIEETGPDAIIPPQFAHVVTKYLGGDIENPFDLSEDLELKAGDIYLICSDGLWECLTAEHLTESFKQLSQPTQADSEEPVADEAASVYFRPGEFELHAKQLAQSAVRKGSGDDVTLVLLACYE